MRPAKLIRILPLLAILSCTAHPVHREATQGMGFEQARHLLNRTGFGAAPQEIRSFASMNQEQAITRLLDTVRQTALTPPPDWTSELPQSLRVNAPDDALEKKMIERAPVVKMRKEERWDLRSWWYEEMLHTDSPLTERMVLFWHNHFTSSLHKVRNHYFLYRQNALLREHARGNFRDLLQAIAKDPAMLRYLDTNTNSNDNPNENFARELMELFTLGQGYYTETDVKEAARAFTGWNYDRQTGAFVLEADNHDNGIKTFLGQRGNFTGEEIIEIVLEQPQTAVFITEKFWRAFISDEPDAQEIQRLAQIFREDGYEIKPLMRALLLSEAFWDPALRGTLVKSPVELIVGTFRTFGFSPRDLSYAASLARGLGQDIFNPLSVEGWPGGIHWLNSETLLEREQFLDLLWRHQMNEELDPLLSQRMGIREMLADGFDLSSWLKGLGEAQTSENALIQTLLPIEPVHPLPQMQDPSVLIGALLLDPAYQLK